MIRVGMKPEWITSLKHNLSFATDGEVNKHILTRYRLYEYLTPCEPDNKAILQSIIDEWSTYVNKLYETTLYEYNPIENYHRYEKEHKEGEFDENNDSTETPKNRKTTTSNSGYENNNLTKTAEVEISGTVNVKTDKDGTNSDDRDLEAWGNIGTMSTQDMIDQERKLIIDCLDFYVKKFAEAFNLSMEVNCYGFFR